MKFVTRAEWGARPPRGTAPIGDVRGCTIHWNGPGLGSYDHGECAGIVRSFQNYHMDSHGWQDLGYNLLSCRHGYVFEGRGLGVRGAHEEDLNADWYGIQAMVGVGDETTDELYDGLREAIAYCRRGGAGNGINAHRDADATECPGDELYRWVHGNPMEDEDDMPSAREVAHELMHGIRIDDPTRYPKGEGRPAGADDVTLAEILQRLLAESYGADIVPLPESAYSEAYREKNPNFTGPNASGRMWDRIERTFALVQKLAGQSGVDVDEAELAANLLPGLLAELNPEAIAAAVADALPEYQLIKKES